MVGYSHPRHHPSWMVPYDEMGMVKRCEVLLLIREFLTRLCDHGCFGNQMFYAIDGTCSLMQWFTTMSRFKRRLQNFQKGIVTIVACLLIGVVSLLFSQPALALTQVKLFDLSYEVCPAEVGQGVVTSDGSAQPATCYLVKGKAQNDSNKLVINADVFGRIYDANNNPVFQNRNRLGAIDEVPPGVSDFEIRVSIASNQPAPLRLSQFKAAGFTGTVRR